MSTTYFSMSSKWALTSRASSPGIDPPFEQQHFRQLFVHGASILAELSGRGARGTRHGRRRSGIIRSGEEDAMGEATAPGLGLPAWAEEMRQVFKAGATSQFVLHGNVFDLVPAPDGKGGADFVALGEFLTGTMFQPFDVVVRYDRGRGVRIEPPDPSRAGRLQGRRGGVPLPQGRRRLPRRARRARRRGRQGGQARPARPAAARPEARARDRRPHPRLRPPAHQGPGRQGRWRARSRSR